MKNLKIIFLLMILSFFVVPDSFALISEQEALSKFVSASMAYKNEQYDEAIMKYNQIIEGGRESGAVYYNLGNCYFRKDDLGRAVLNYERAKRLIPRDSDLNFNEQYVSSRITKYSNAEKTNVFNQMMRNYTGFYTVDDMAIIIVVSIFVLGIIILLSLYSNWPKSLAQSMAAFVAVVVIVYTVGLVAKIEYTKNLAVVVTRAESYFEPRADSTVHFKLSEGMKVRIKKSEGKWIKIERADGKIGWVSVDTLEKI